MFGRNCGVVSKAVDVLQSCGILEFFVGFVFLFSQCDERKNNDSYDFEAMTSQSRGT